MPDTETSRRSNPVAAADDVARAQAMAMMRAARHAALAYLDPDCNAPGISRIAYGVDMAGHPLTLISALAAHARALQANPVCAVMLGEPGEKGDPLTHPRLMIRAEAQFVAGDAPERAALRAHWLKGHPKAALYVDFADFSFVRLQPLSALLNMGFARAYQLTAQDLTG